MRRLKTDRIAGLAAVAIAAFAALSFLAPTRVGISRAGIPREPAANGSTLREIPLGGFAFTHELVLPGSPDTIYDALTGDLSGWWDHTFSEKPARFYLEAKPGGGFYEIFDESGDGVLHGTVIYADRGKRLRFDGPLGLSGRAVQLVTTYELEARGDSTRLAVAVHAAGEMEEGLAEGVEDVWRHFLFERFKPYVETGKHLSGPSGRKGSG